ncbi:MAG: tRNA (N6-isopentenyl adenosine(37)-C2)-methylthiotransferase MiaB [Alphaproteobacteria bacterium]|nr:tRNA (N6-isopentenyl adenosine(37)-C2)-methylthiotransferase MiaB [Alphaproteobacteria bacterium]MBD22725.1 tRNA (N6-isopentenyl adenosine(37)-C2)-methylthiotransferase MiaB [Alphaproteobacteria bacterium]
MHRSFFIKTYGCQMNSYDSEKINDLLLFNGFRKAEDLEKTDVAILNTCHIREKASEKLYSDLGRLSIFKKNKEKLGKKFSIVVMGCVAQAEGKEIINRNNSVDYVVGPQNIQIIPNLLKKENFEKVHVNFLSEEKFQSLTFSKTNKTASMISIQEGCDKFCSFCVVPYTRGAEFSRTVEDIYAEINHVVQKGTKEVTLLGQNVSSYESTIYEDKEKKIKLANLCNIISKIPRLKRIRYLTSHPNDIDNYLISEHAKNEKMMPFLHLPIQSGSDKILKKMNRKHTKKQYLDLVKKIKLVVPKMAFSSDFIVGYPGETEEDFEQTVSVVNAVKFASSYSFVYSSRPGTPASTQEDVINPEVKKKRLTYLQELLIKHQNNFNNFFLDKEVEVLITDVGKKDNQYVGRTPHLQPVHVYSKKNLIGKILNIKIERLTSFSFHGKILN